MKKSIRFLLIALAFMMASTAGFAQDEADQAQQKHKILKQNGGAFVGVIVSQDARELLLQSEEVGLVYIPKHEIKEIIIIERGEDAYAGGLFATRYFLTTNGFNINRGDNYVQWNIFGPDFQFGVRDNFTVGIMTSWVGIPIIATTKYSRQITDGIYGGVGFLGGTGSWAFPRYGLALPFGFVSLGNRVNNVNFTGGYGALFTEQTESVPRIINVPTEWSTNQYEYDNTEKNRTEGRPLFSIAGMFKINTKFSFVFDSFFMLSGKDRVEKEVREQHNPGSQKVTYYLEDRVIEANPLVVLAPGLRFQANESSSFQFGFTGVHFDGEFVPVPIPMIQWFKRIDR